MLHTEKLVVAGKEIWFETGRLAKQADSAVLVRQGDTMILVTVVGERELKEGKNFFPLTVEYREGQAAAGRIPGGFLKRRMRSSDQETLVSRLIDRSLRPLFPEDFRCEIQVIATLLSFDPSADPGVLAICGAALALHISDIPWNGPVAGARVVRSAGRCILNPGAAEKELADLDLVLSGGPNGLVMAEGALKEGSEEDVLAALSYAQEGIAPLLDFMESWKRNNGSPKRSPPPSPAIDPIFAGRIRETFGASLVQILHQGGSKHERSAALDDLLRQTVRAFALEDPVQQGQVKTILEDLLYEEVRRMLREERRRIDGRDPVTIRPIAGEVGWLPRTHGSALFTRGETQAMVTCTLGTGQDEQIIETLEGDERERFLLHYNFPPYSVGEIRPLRGPGRREIGHGELARRALEPVLPDHEHFPYTIRIVSDISESNGSSSMATVCGGCLALMDAGVQIASPVAGIAMGLLQEKEDAIVLSDILGDEDHLGDMDFKVAGTRKGITALQLDNKLGALPPEVLAKALEQARQGRVFILDEMAKVLPAPRDSLSPHAPRVCSLKIRKERIRELIGPGGKIIQQIQKDTDTRIQVDDEGTVRIYSTNESDLDNALRLVNHYTAELEIGKVYRGVVVSVKEFGAFVRIYSSIEGLVHISELEPHRVNRVSDVVREGDEIIVKVLDVDSQGKVRLSRKAALNTPVEAIQN